MPGATAPSTTAAAYAALFPAAAYRAHLAAGTRPDGRTPTDARPLTVTLRAVGGADGSALVRVGRTTVLACVLLEVCGVGGRKRGVACFLLAATRPTLLPHAHACPHTYPQVTTPSISSPDSGGVFVFAADAPPLAAADAAPGRPPPRLDGIAAYVRAVLTAAGAIDAADLAVAAASGDGDASTPPPSLALAARIDLTILDADGGEPGAALIAAAAALADTRVPGVTLRDGACVREEKLADAATRRATGLLRCLPAAASLALVDDAVVVDPDAAEAALADALVSVAVGGDGAIVAADAPGVTTTAARDGTAPILIPPSVLLAAAGAARARQHEALVAIQAGVK